MKQFLQLIWGLLFAAFIGALFAITFIYAKGWY
jgi:uncharacterized membrane protein YgaE (UPF0421/DUF939 family)